ncbi:MAG: serine hydrolase [Desulfobulbaceae bacterium]|nr:serine hydrolase [Desulfobulbaceae bacterium]
MIRFIFQVQLVFTFLFLLPCSQTEASALPVFDTAAKQVPGSTTASRPATSTEAVVLGKRADISVSKARPGKARPGKARIAGSGLQYSRLPDVRKKITSRSAIIIDAQTGETLFAKNADTPRQPASTIKVLTGMIALKSLELNELVEVSSKAAGMPRSKIYLDTKKTYKADDLINAVLLASANDASVALAEKVAGSETQFAEMMTLRARLWGAENTVCRTASGLTAEGQMSTARDLANIFRHAMQDEDFSRRMGKTKVQTSYGKLLQNHNKALWTVDGAEGGKTGYTKAARQTYVGQFSGDAGSIIVAVMGSETMWDDISNLVAYGFQRQKQGRMAESEMAEKGKQVALAK